MCVCVCEREREREREKKTTEKDTVGVLQEPYRFTNWKWRQRRIRSVANVCSC